jgi:hypothetical protein
MEKEKNVETSKETKLSIAIAKIGRNGTDVSMYVICGLAIKG